MSDGRRRGLVFLQCCDDAPFVFQMLDQRLDCLVGVADVFVLQFFNVDFIDCLCDYAFHDDGVCALLFVVVFGQDFVKAKKSGAVDECCLVGQALWVGAWFWLAFCCCAHIVGDALIFDVVDN